MSENKKHLNSDFIPYELSLKLFELGMDDKFEYGEYSIYGHYYKRRSNLNKNDDNLYPLDIGYVEYNQNFEQWNPESYGIAPLWQQAFDWFREKHQIHIFIETHYDEEFFPKFDQTSHPHKIDTDVIRKILPKCKTIEEARYEGLKRLIEIIEKK